MFRRITTLILNLLLALLLVVPCGFSQSAAPSEYHLKAAFIYNFAKFIDWPPESFSDEKSPFVIGILGNNPFGNILEQTVTGKEVSGHPFAVRPSLSSVAEAAKCHLVFISSSEKDRIPGILKSLEGTSILTISETEQFTKRGGMVNFVHESNKIRFQINDQAAKNARLKISSKLLSLALSPSR